MRRNFTVLIFASFDRITAPNLDVITEGEVIAISAELFVDHYDALRNISKINYSEKLRKEAALNKNKHKAL